MKLRIKEEIMALISAKTVVKVAEIGAQLSIPRTSLLRYLAELEDEGKITKHFGEVKIRTSSTESFAFSRIHANVAAKKQIAHHALGLIPNNAVLFLDGGSTTYFLALALKHKPVTIYTNSLLVANLANADYVPEVHLLPGQLRKLTQVVASPITIEALQRVAFDLVFVGFNSLQNQYLATTNEDEMVLKRAAIASARNGAYALGRQAKAQEVAPYRFAELGEAQLITESGFQG